MRVLHVTPYFHGAWSYGGIPRLSYHLAAAQASLGHEVHAVTTDVMDEHGRLAPRDYTVSGVEVRVYKNMSNLAAYHLQFFCPLGLGAERRTISGYDVVHIHGHRNLHNHRLAAMARQAGTLNVMQPNGTLVNIERRRGLKTVYDLLLGRSQVKGTDGFIAVSQIEKAQFVEMGVPEELIEVHPNGVAVEESADEVSFKKEFRIDSDYLLYLGKITPRKGVEHVISALPLLADESIIMVVAGNDMGYREVLERKARALGLASRVVFTGLLTGQMKAAAFREALYTVYAGRDEIFGLVPWESLLYGTPVIVADDSGCGEWVRKGKAGHVVPYASPESIARIVNQYDPDRERETVKRGAAFCRERLDWVKIAEDMISFYTRLLDDRASRKAGGVHG